MTSLKDVQFSKNLLSGSLPSEIGNCVQLENLDIQDNQLSGQLTSSLGNLERLSQLKVYKNVFSGTLPTEVCNLKEEFELAFLSADCNGDDGGTITCDCCDKCYP
jgi:hypothetical protein